MRGAGVVAAGARVQIVKNEGHGRAVDWWSLGVLIYEMLYAHLPFAPLPAQGRARGGKGAREPRLDPGTDEYKAEVKKRILNGKVTWPRGPYTNAVSNAAKNLMQRLLAKSPEQRLRGEAVMQHEFFRSIDWDALRLRQVWCPCAPCHACAHLVVVRNWAALEAVRSLCWVRARRQAATPICMHGAKNKDPCCRCRARYRAPSLRARPTSSATPAWTPHLSSGRARGLQGTFLRRTRRRARRSRGCCLTLTASRTCTRASWRWRWRRSSVRAWRARFSGVLSCPVYAARAVGVWFRTRLRTQGRRLHYIAFLDA